MCLFGRSRTNNFPAACSFVKSRDRMFTRSSERKIFPKIHATHMIRGARSTSLPYYRCGLLARTIEIRVKVNGRRADGAPRQPFVQFVGRCHDEKASDSPGTGKPHSKRRANICNPFVALPIVCEPSTAETPSQEEAQCERAQHGRGPNTRIDPITKGSPMRRVPMRPSPMRSRAQHGGSQCKD